MIGAHSVIDRPDPVRRVAPPTTTIPKTIAVRSQSQILTGLRSIAGETDCDWDKMDTPENLKCECKNLIVPASTCGKARPVAGMNIWKGFG